MTWIELDELHELMTGHAKHAITVRKATSQQAEELSEDQVTQRAQIVNDLTIAASHIKATMAVVQRLDRLLEVLGQGPPADSN